MNQKQVELIKKHYKEGDRVKLSFMNDPYTRLSQGDKGTVTDVDDIGQIHVNWDCGSTLALNYEEDEFRTM
ncbi:DUF4314 domain-containing protein [Mammaliicoccus vitulinus]|uniref:DUF4314 domain-containing protein n=1 Tax=Mammaliicoccus vitulinus TaxID=71237 RepID=UPI00248CF885|nr:DUF4314 domain-containing protein [Mammaliicoccus vitulinus]